MTEQVFLLLHFRQRGQTAKIELTKDHTVASSALQRGKYLWCNVKAKLRIFFLH